MGRGPKEQEGEGDIERRDVLGAAPEEEGRRSCKPKGEDEAEPDVVRAIKTDRQMQGGEGALHGRRHLAMDAHTGRRRTWPVPCT
jgi:hypothetical protein